MGPCFRVVAGDHARERVPAGTENGQKRDYGAEENKNRWWVAWRKVRGAQFVGNLAGDVSSTSALVGGGGLRVDMMMVGTKPPVEIKARVAGARWPH